MDISRPLDDDAVRPILRKRCEVHGRLVKAAPGQAGRRLWSLYFFEAVPASVPLENAVGDIAYRASLFK